jgi:hypothetical protein
MLLGERERESQKKSYYFSFVLCHPPSKSETTSYYAKNGAAQHADEITFAEIFYRSMNFLQQVPSKISNLMLSSRRCLILMSRDNDRKNSPLNFCSSESFRSKLLLISRSRSAFIFSSAVIKTRKKGS